MLRSLMALVCAALVLLDVLRASHHPSFYRSVLVNPDLGILHLTALTLLMTDVEDEMRRLGLWEGEAKEGNSVGCCHLGIDVIVLKQHLIVACRSKFFVVGKGRAIAARSCTVGIAGCGEQDSRRGSHCDATHLELMGADKALDGLVAIVVACSLPTIGIA